MRAAWWIARPTYSSPMWMPIRTLSAMSSGHVASPRRSWPSAAASSASSGFEKAANSESPSEPSSRPPNCSNAVVRRLLWSRSTVRYRAVLLDHRSLLTTAFEQFGGRLLGSEGDSLFAAFSNPEDALLAAAEGQLLLGEATWPDDIALKVRMGIHIGA